MAADELRGIDKMPLQQFVTLVAAALIGAHQEIEAAYPEWEVGSCEVTLRGVVKPGTQNGKPVILLDVDEPAGAPITEIPLPLRRKPT
jgi:hypothetical protein